MGAFAGTVGLLIEAQDPGYLGPHLAREGTSLEAGRPVAYVYEKKEEAAAAVAAAAAAEQQEGGMPPEPPAWSVYDGAAPSAVPVLAWQSYLRDKHEGGKGGCG